MIRPLTLITGASRGIGAEITRQAAKQGHDLILVARSLSPALSAVAAEATAAGSQVRVLPCDLADPSAILALFDQLNDLDRPLTGLVNNAVHVGTRGPLVEMDLEDLDRVLATNVRAPLLMCRGALARMGHGGTIINLSSQSAQFGGNGLSAYAASKAAINGLTISLAREVAGRGIRVVGVSPGPVKTEPLLSLPPERLAAMERDLPMGRFCTAAEIAQTVLWLMSVEASYISGVILPVHGAR